MGREPLTMPCEHSSVRAQMQSVLIGRKPRTAV